jgi:hypothetical protein
LIQIRSFEGRLACIAGLPQFSFGASAPLSARVSRNDCGWDALRIELLEDSGPKVHYQFGLTTSTRLRKDALQMSAPWYERVELPLLRPAPKGSQCLLRFDQLRVKTQRFLVGHLRIRNPAALLQQLPQLKVASRSGMSGERVFQVVHCI